MVTTDLTKNNSGWSALCLALGCLISAVCLGAEVEGEITIGASYTDDVQLGATPDDIDSVIYQASPFFSIIHETPTLDTNINYSFDWYRYDELKSTSKYHRGDVTITGKAWQDTLLTELGARRSQRLGDPTDVIPGGRLLNSGNLVDENEWWINPVLSRNLGNAIALRANYRYSRNQIDDSQYQDSTSNFGELGIDNYRAGTGLTWALRYAWRRAEFEVSAPWEFQQAGAELGYWVNTKTRVFGAGGKESSWDNLFDPSMDDPFWEAGFAHQAGEKLVVEFAVGERSFGSSWRGKFDYKLRRGNTSLSYSESPTTPDFNRIAQGGQVQSSLNPAELDDFLSQPGSADRYISSRFEWTLDLDFRRTGIDLRVFDEDRSDRFGADGSTLDAQSQTGVAVNFSWQAGVRTDLGISGSMVNRATGDGAKSKYSSAGLSVKYRLGSRSDVSLAYSYNEQQPRGQSSGGPDYVANLVSLLFTFTI